MHHRMENMHLLDWSIREISNGMPAVQRCDGAGCV